LIKRSGSLRFGGFTLIEVLLVLALVGVLAGLVAGNAGAFITGSKYEPPGRVLKKAILDAIYFSSETKESTYLFYLEDNASFLVKDASGGLLSRHKVYEGQWDEDYELPEIQFTAIGPESGPDGGSTMYDEEQLSLKRVHFHYGSSVPFLADIRFRGEESLLQFDPFSGFVLKPKE